MDPVAFELFGLQIRWYGVIITLGMLLGILLSIRQVRRQGENEEWFLDMMLIAIPVGLVFARLYYVVFNWADYAGDLGSALNFRQGGMAIHGGVMGGVLVGYFYVRYRKVNFWKWVDIAAPSLILAQAIGRWGNFFNQEAYGVPTKLPWAMLIAGEYRHPTFLYESLWNLAVFALLMWVIERKSFDGQVAALYAIGYSSGRVWIEGLRTDSLMLGPIRVAQLVSVALIVAGTLFYWWKSARAKSVKAEDESQIINHES